MASTATLSELQHPTAWMTEAFGGQPVSSKVYVSPATSLGLSTYYACIRAIAEDCAKLPFQVFELMERGRRKAPEHWLSPLLGTEFNEQMTAFIGRELLTSWALGWGNGYARIIRDQSMTRYEGEVIGLEPLHPRRVVVQRDRQTGRLLYLIRAGVTGREAETFGVVDQGDMLHLRGPGSDGILGYSIAQIAAESLGLSLAAQQYGASFFGNSGRPGGILSHPGRLEDKARVNLRESWEATHGGTSNAGKTAVLEEGITWTPITIPPEQAQFLDTRNFQVREICRWFRMPPHKVADLSDAKWANVESENISYVVDTLGPWFVRWEQEIQSKLLPESSYYAKHNVTALLRGDMAARAEYYRALVGIGVYSLNEVRELEEMSPFEGGDEHFLQLNMSTVKRIADGTAQPRRALRPAPPVPAASTNGQRRGYDDAP
jgi:HK97 family phage portal protein